jgi:hypothetical protein
MRVCPTCSSRLKDFNYFFCDNCLSELPQNKVKVPSPHLINIKLDFALIPQERFLFFNIPYENRYSLRIIKILFYVVMVASLVSFIFYNLKYGF